MRKLCTILAAAGLVFSLALPASSGTLTGATLTYQVSLSAQPYTVPFVASVAATGSSTATSATLGAGWAFQGTATFTNVPLFATAHITIDHNGRLSATSGGAVTTTAPITGRAIFGKLSAPLLTVPIIAAGGTSLPDIFGELLKATLQDTQWHIGPVSTTGFFVDVTTSGIRPQVNGTVLSTTTGGKKRIRVATTGSFNLTANGAGTVKLVSLNHVIVSGLSSSDTVAPTVLTLTYAAPEPGTLLLLGAGIAGMVAAGRRRRLA